MLSSKHTALIVVSLLSLSACNGTPSSIGGGAGGSGAADSGNSGLSAKITEFFSGASPEGNAAVQSELQSINTELNQNPQYSLSQEDLNMVHEELELSSQDQADLAQFTK